MPYVGVLQKHLAPTKANSTKRPAEAGKKPDPVAREPAATPNMGLLR